MKAQLPIISTILLLFSICFAQLIDVVTDEREDSAAAAVALVDLPTFPDIEEVYEMAKLSSLIYENSKKNPMLPDGWKLEYYEDKVSTGNVMVISSTANKRVAIVFAGSDGINDWMDDIDITQEPIGPTFKPINRDAWVHSGFNNVLFEKRIYEKTDMYDRIKKSMLQVLEREGDEYKITLAGHSLGGALSVLAGAALSHQMPDREYTVINFGCPRQGGKHFHTWSNKMENLNVWRFVYHRDIVPRTPGETRFYHAGHTIQLESTIGAKAYYHHKGSKELNLAGVPNDWKDGKSSSNHYMSNYIDYFEGHAYLEPSKYYVDSFEKASETDIFDGYNEEKDSWWLEEMDELKETASSFLRKTRSKIS